MEVPIEQIRPSPYQPRLSFDLEDIREGVVKALKARHLPNLVVRKVKDYYELIDGERRWRIAKQDGFKTVPCQIVDVNDETARGMVYKVNKERKSYTTEEEATYFKKLVEEEGMKPYQIEVQLDVDHHWVQACLNIWKFPKDIRDNVFGNIPNVPYKISMTDILNLETIINRNLSEAIAIVRQVIDKRMTSDEKKRFITGREKKIDEERLKKAEEALGKPEVKTLETAEEYEKAAKALMKKAKELKTPEQKHQEMVEKAWKSLNSFPSLGKAEELGIDIESYKEKLEEIKGYLEERPKEAWDTVKALKKEFKAEEKVAKKQKGEEERKRREEEIKRRIEEEAKKRARELEETQKRQIEEEAKAKAREELLRDTEFVRQFIEKEYPLMPDTMKTEDLEKELMQRLIASVPEEKRERAEDIFREEFRSLRKRLDIFPEKSEKIEPKFERLRLLEERGVLPYTVWDFPYRDDYAGDKKFHGNCSPQIVEQCIWRLTNEGDLVVDPMAGSGTALDVCKKFNRRCIGYDIKPPKNRSDIIQNDSRKIPLESNSVDMIFIHPPYWNLTYFTKAEENLPDLSRAKNVDEFIDMLEQAFRECHRILKSEKFMCVLLGDLIREGKFVPLCRKTTNMAEKVGFEDYGYAVKLAHGEVSRKKSGVIIAEPIYTHNLKISHDLVMFFRKKGAK